MMTKKPRNGSEAVPSRAHETTKERLMSKLTSMVVLSICFAACAGNDKKPSGAAKKGPKQPKALTQKPPTAMAAGTGSSVMPTGEGSNTAALTVPGGGDVALFSWQASIDNTGQLADCVGAFGSDGSAAVACGPFTDTCDDGSALDAGLLVFFDASQNVGAFALAGSDLCGSGVDIVGCTFDGDGNVGSCGAAAVVADHIDVTAS
jgi:hypothetical protein